MKTLWQKITTWLQVWLVEPFSSAEAVGLNRRVARLLAGLLLVFSVSALLRLFYTILWGQSLAASLFTLCICSLAYCLSRTRHYPLAAGMALFLLALPSYINTLNGPDFSELEIRSHLAWLILPIVFGSIFLSIPGQVTATVLILAGIICLPLVKPEISFSSIYGSLGQLGTAASFLLVMLRHHRRLENDRQMLLQQREARYRALFERTNDAVFIFDLNSVVQEVNIQGATLLGYQVEEMPGMPTSALVAPSELTDNRTKRQALLRGEVVPLYERVFRHKDGSEIPAEVSVAIVHDDTGQPMHIQSIVRDIRERKRSEQEREQLIEKLEAKNTELERFTYTVSHDLKSPLVTIQGFLGFLEKDWAAGKTEQAQRDIARIYSAIEKMRQLLDDLLALSRAGQQKGASAKISLTQISQEAIELVRGRLDKRGVEIRLADNLPDVWGDHARLLQVFQNLLDNAIKFMGEQPQPCITIGFLPGENDALAHIYVQDNGMGITPEAQNKIFDLFERLGNHSEGTGVGLALVQRIIGSHGGHIWVESDGEGQGSTFHFTLPILPSHR
jgi:PAS domain S-box-containing protein